MQRRKVAKRNHDSTCIDTGEECLYPTSPERGWWDALVRYVALDSVSGRLRSRQLFQARWL